MKKVSYVCVNSSCGHVEFTTNGYATSKPCPKCNTPMNREDT